VDVFRLTNSDGTPVPMMESARDLMWMRPLTLVEQRQRYLHKYTHLSGYLEACLMVQLGAGTAQYSSNGRACDDIRPGIWRVSLETASSVFDGKRLPSCVDGEWMSTPQVKCCRDIGYDVQVREGYYWPQSQELVKQWAMTLWQAGERLHTHPQGYRHVEARANASHTIKLLAQLGMSIVTQKETEGGWSRHDWWAQILGRSRAALFAHLVRLGRKGIMPVLVAGDALWVVSNDPNPLTAVPGLVNGPKWRGYSVGYEVPLPLSSEVRKAFREVGQAGELVVALDGLASR
jgi:hypothetical protein